jgi:hypothetical protein
MWQWKNIPLGKKNSKQQALCDDLFYTSLR